MPYSQKMIQTINGAAPTMGTLLGKWSVRRDISMQRISQIVGATRQTVYNWFTGATEVTPAYQERVTEVINVLKSTSQTEDAWRVLCNKFNVRS